MRADKILRRNLLSRKEHHVLQLMRGSGSLPADEEAIAAFLRLARQARSAGLSISGVAIPYVTGDERLLLGWLALLQRQRPDYDRAQERALEPGLLEALRACALLLDRAGYRLDCRLARGVAEYDAPAAQATARKPADLASMRSVVKGGTLQAKVLQFVTESGTATTHELNVFGASRQVLSIMYKKGLLRRVQHGLYAARHSSAPHLHLSSS